MKRSEALKIIALYKHESPEVILTALEMEAGYPEIWDPEYENREPTPWKPKEFASELEYQLHCAYYRMLQDLNRQLFDIPEDERA